jgi:hypothetical protein
MFKLRTPPEPGTFSHRLSKHDLTLLSSDAFAGAYASDYMRQKTTGGWDNRSAVVGANKVATITFTSLGVQEGIPWSDNIDNFDAPVKRLEFIRSKLPTSLGGGA